MAVTLQYLVVRNGITKMTFTDKKEADAYDRLLDLADQIDELLSTGPVELNEQDRENLALFLAQSQDRLIGLSKKKPARTKEKSPDTVKAVA
ncbi:YebG family protein [Zobellella maritima]|uniref:YebG family protein n=1 Tax=Zobellella maritima TaxID=2059725 RepID=UPI000E303103|nr:YebG family protein [Zobellella maritima]